MTGLRPIGPILAASALVAVGLVPPAKAQVPGTAGTGSFLRADATAAPDKVVFGDTVRYTVLVEWSGDYTVESAIPTTTTEALLLVSSDLPDVSRTGDGSPRNEWRQTFTFRAVQPGAIDIPPFAVTYRAGAAGPKETVQTPPKTIHVDALETGAAQGKLEPLTPPQAIRFDWTLRNLLFIGAGVVFGSLVVLAWLLYRRYASRRKVLRLSPPARPAHEIALEQLDELGRSTYLRDGRFKIFFTQLSEIVRRYIQHRYSCPALDWTSEEILEALGTRGEPGQDERRRLARIFETCDLVKFAKWTPPDDAGAAALEQARQFVEATRPLLQEAAA